MKTLAWQRFLDEQRERHGKTLFTVAELANAARTSLHALNMELARLIRRGLIARYAQGIYGLPRGVPVHAVVEAVDATAYATGFHALFEHNKVTQAPAEVACFTTRRHNLRSNRATPAGRLHFVCVPSLIYKKPPISVSPEQALCDFYWLMLRDGLDPRSLVTFRNLHTLNSKRLSSHLKRYPDAVQRMVAQAAAGETS